MFTGRYSWMIAAVALTVAAPMAMGPAMAADWTVRTKKIAKDSHCDDPGSARELTMLGPADVSLSRGNTEVLFAGYASAVGRPDRQRLVDPSHLVATWKGRHAAKLNFLTFGGGTDRDLFALQYGKLTGKGWVTQRGIRVGNSLTQARNMYGREMWRTQDGPKGTWRIAGHCSYPIGEGDGPVLTVKIRDGRIVWIGVMVGAAGE